MANPVRGHSSTRVLKGAPAHRKHRNICVFCGSNSGNGESFKKQAEELAKVFVANDVGLVYGGASVGIMGTIADAVLAGGGRAYGVIPQALADREVAHKNLTELRVVTTMHERKKLMFDLSDGFITFPGGFGTLDETFEIITWKQIDIHDKPVVLLNVDGFFTPLVEFIDKAVNAGFIRQEHRQLFHIETEASAAVQTILASTNKLG